MESQGCGVAKSIMDRDALKCASYLLNLLVLISVTDFFFSNVLGMRSIMALMSRKSGKLTTLTW